MTGKLITGEKPSRIFDIEVQDKDTFDMPCPVCSYSRKPQHQKEKVLNVNQSKRTARCNHCGIGFKFVYEHEFRNGAAAEIININGLENLSGKILEYWTDKRKISHEILIAAGVKQGTHIIKTDKGFENKMCTAFVYHQNSIQMMIKYRDNLKNFSISKGSKLIFYGLDYIKGQTTAIIVEGEPDRLSYMTAGITNVVSVPNGVTISIEELTKFRSTGKIDVSSQINLKYLDDAWEGYFKDKEIIYLGTDNDAAGIKLRTELIRRIGVDKCRIIDYSKYPHPSRENGCKDGNDVLVHHGTEVLKNTIRDAQESPMDDVVTIDMIENRLLDVYNHGTEKGKSTGFLSLDPHFNWILGHPVVLNGYGGNGKTSFALVMMLLTALIYDWKWGAYCPENYPVHNVFQMLMEIFTGETFDRNAKKRMSMIQFNTAYDFIKSHFFMVDSQEDRSYSPEDLRLIARQLVMKKGINGFFTDPWNSLTHKLGNRQLDQYLEEELSAEIRFATKMNVIKLVNVHPPTPLRQKETAYRHPTKFEIRGGNIWNNKFYEMICIDIPPGQDYYNTESDVYIQKVKDHKLVGIPTGEENPIKFHYVRKSRRFTEKHEGEERDPFDHVKGFTQGTLTFEEF